MHLHELEQILRQVVGPREVSRLARNRRIVGYNTQCGGNNPGGVRWWEGMVGEDETSAYAWVHV